MIERLKEWRKENLLIMKELAGGLRVLGSDPEIEWKIRWFAQDSVRLKELIKIYGR